MSERLPARVVPGVELGVNQYLHVRRDTGVPGGVRRGMLLCLFADQVAGQAVGGFLCRQSDLAGGGVIRRDAGLFADRPGGSGAHRRVCLYRDLQRRPLTSRGHGRRVHPATSLPLSMWTGVHVGLFLHLSAARRGNETHGQPADRHTDAAEGAPLCQAVGKPGPLVPCAWLGKTLCQARDLMGGRRPRRSVGRSVYMNSHEFEHQGGRWQLCQSHSGDADLAGSRSAALTAGAGVGQERGRPIGMSRCPQVTRCQNRQRDLSSSRLPGRRAGLSRQLHGQLQAGQGACRKRCRPVW